MFQVVKDLATGGTHIQPRLVRGAYALATLALRGLSFLEHLPLIRPIDVFIVVGDTGW